MTNPLKDILAAVGDRIDRTEAELAKLREVAAVVQTMAEANAERDARLAALEAATPAPTPDPVPDPTPEPEPQPQPEPTPTDGRTIEVRKGADEHAIRDAIGRLRDGYPDRLLFERGGIYDASLGEWLLSGHSDAEPMIVGAFGEGAAPQFWTHNKGLMWLGGKPVSHVAFEDFSAVANRREPGNEHFDGGTTREYGVRLGDKLKDIVFRRVKLSHYCFNLNGDGGDGLAFIGCWFRHAYALGGSGHSQGFSLGRARNVGLVGCWFDHNGWSKYVDNAPRTGFNQNVYLNAIHGLVVRNNVFSRASALGLKLRGDFAGAMQNVMVHRNLFMDCLTGMSAGADRRDGDVNSLAIDGLDIRHNAFTCIGGNLPNDDNQQGIAIDLKQTTNAAIADNLFAHKQSNNWPPIEACGDGKAFGSLTVEDNRLHDWHSTDGLMRGKAKGVVQRNNREVQGDGRGRDTDAIRARLLSGDLAPGDAAGWVRGGYE